MEEALLKRVLPHSIEAEQSVIGSMLLEKEAIVAASEIVHADDFYQRQYGIIFEAIMELYNEGKPTDLVTLQNRLKSKDVPPEMCEVDFMRELLEAVPISANVRYYAEIVYEKSLLRRLIKVNEEIANRCYIGKDKTEDILEDTEKEIFRLLQNRNTSDYVPIRDVVINVVNKIEQVRDPYLDLRFRTEMTSVGYFDETLGCLNELQSVLDEVNKTGSIHNQLEAVLEALNEFN